MENIFLSEIELFANRLTEDVVADALSTIANDEIYSKLFLTGDEKYLRKIKKKSIQLENIEQQQTDLFNEISYHSSPIVQSLTNNSSSNEESIDFLVINIAQQIYTSSFDELIQ
jgi:hypothetical protein